MRLIRRCFLTLILLGSSVGVTAGVLLSDGFDYPDGSLVSVASNVWVHHSGSTTGEIKVSSAHALLTKNDTEDVNQSFAGGPYSSGSTLVLYIGFTVQFTSLPGSGEQYFAHLKNSSTGFRAKLFASTAGAASSSLRLGITESANSSAAYLPQDLELFTDYRVVVRYDVDTAASTLWVDPVAETDLSVTAPDTSATPITVESFAFRQSSGIGELQIDDIVVATTFDEVVSGDSQPPPSAVPALTLLDYNVAGNGVADWSTNSSQVKAIGRQMQYLDPDVITFQEIPLTNTWQMANFVSAFRPGFYLATNSGTDGYIRSAILSRFPISRSQSWLDGIDLKPFGYTNANPYLDNFTRDLFEAEIMVPGFSEPLHVFTVHLKAGQIEEDASRRAAEAGAISNFFVSTFLPIKGPRPYVLTGDMNEDIARPPASNPQTLQTLTSAPTGLQLTTPRNPLNLDERTWSIRSAGLTRRYDYILPGGLMFSNIVSSQVFRTDLLPEPAPLLGSDSATASDHLPVMMVFSNPFDVPFRLLSITASNATVSITWESVPGRTYAVEAAGILGEWATVVTNLSATETQSSHTFPITSEAQFYRVQRQP